VKRDQNAGTGRARSEAELLHKTALLHELFEGRGNGVAEVLRKPLVGRDIAEALGRALQ
jgi:hypothetical protein